MTYNVLSGTLSLYTTTTSWQCALLIYLLTFGLTVDSTSSDCNIVAIAYVKLTTVAELSNERSQNKTRCWAIAERPRSRVR